MKVLESTFMLNRKRKENMEGGDFSILVKTMNFSII